MKEVRTMSLTEPLGVGLGHETLSVKDILQGGQAAKLNICEGWRVHQVGNETPNDFQEFQSILAKLKLDGALTVALTFEIPELNTIAHNKDCSTFRDSVFETDDEIQNRLAVSGYLMKKGTNVVNPWQNRYFVAENHYLKYFKSKKVSKQTDYCLAAIDLNLCKVSEPTGKIFELLLMNTLSEKIKLCFKANDNADAIKWVSALRQLQFYFNEADKLSRRQSEGAPLVETRVEPIPYSTLLKTSRSASSPVKPIPYSDLVAAAEQRASQSGSLAVVQSQRRASETTTSVPSAPPVLPPSTTMTPQDLPQSILPPASSFEHLPCASSSGSTTTQTDSAEIKDPAPRSVPEESTISSLSFTSKTSQPMNPTRSIPSTVGDARQLTQVWSPLPERHRLSSKAAPHELQRQEVPEHLKPAPGEVNPLSNEPLSTAPVGQERKVARRRSVTSRRCQAGSILSMNSVEGECECNNYHFRDSPFCHQHALFDPESVRISAGGSSELEDALNKALEMALDHHVISNPSQAHAEGEAILASLPPMLAQEFADPVECFQINNQFKAFLSYAGDNGDGKLQAAELLACAKRIGDDLDSEKVNMEWANTLVSGVLGRDDNSPGDEGIDLLHFMATIRQMRKSFGVDAKSVSEKVKKLKHKESVDDEDADSDDDNEGDSQWHYPIKVPLGATPGTVVTVPLPGGDSAYVLVEDQDAVDSVLKCPMTEKAVSACVKQAVKDAASGASISPGDQDSVSAISEIRPPIEGAPAYEPGIGAVYAAIKGRQRFCLNAFLALREASALACDLPPMQGWMLKRGDALSVGYLNSWKLRYFRLEGTELVYYENEPANSDFAETHFHYQNNTGRRSNYVERARESAASEGRVPTDEELAAAMVEEQNEMIFDDKNCKGSINMSEIVDIQFSVKTAVSISAAKLFVYRVAPGSSQPVLTENMDGEDLADSMIVFKVTTAKMRRYVLSVPYEQAMQVMVLFSKHVHFARASLRFRREFGSGVQQGLTLGEKIQWAASTYGARILLAGMLMVYDNKFIKDTVLGYPLFTIGPLKVTPAKIITSLVVTKTVHEIYIASKYADREKKYGVKWQYKQDVFYCFLCQTKFPTIALKIEHQKHHCRMCGRVVCHACASTKLFYKASGKRQRTCDFCIGNGGPPEKCKANAMNQKSVISLALEAKRKADLEAKEKKAKDQALQTGACNEADLIKEKNKHKISDYAQWCDWGIVPHSNKATSSARLSVPRTSSASYSNLPTSSTSSSYTSMMKENVSFSVFIPTEAKAGDTLEVTLPDGENKAITYIDPKACPTKVQQVSISFGQDGIFFVLPPKDGHNFELIAEAKKRQTAAEMVSSAMDTAKSVSGALHSVSELGSMVGVKVPQFDF